MKIYKYLFKYIPVRLQKWIYNVFFKRIDDIINKIKLEHPLFAEQQEDIAPIYEISDKHIAGLKAITNREELLKYLPKKAVVAEIGIAEGYFSELILKITTPAKLHLIDSWSTDRYNEELMHNVENKFIREIKNGTIEINKGLSTVVVNKFYNNYFDWIYIDTDHTYKITKEELEKYSTKVKPFGIIAGHDFLKDRRSIRYRYGVIEAVYEFCVRYDWEIIYMTMEFTSGNPSFAIRRIKTLI